MLAAKIAVFAFVFSIEIAVKTLMLPVGEPFLVRLTMDIVEVVVTVVMFPIELVMVVVVLRLVSIVGMCRGGDSNAQRGNCGGHHQGKFSHV